MTRKYIWKMSEGAKSFFSLSATEVAPVREASPAPERIPGLVPEQPPRPRRAWRKWLIGLVALAGIVLAALVIRSRTFSAKNGTNSSTVQTAMVTRKDFVRRVRLHGIVEAVESHAISAPRLSGQSLSGLIITKLVKNGSTVHRGDVVVEFDREAQAKNMLDKRAEYLDLVDQIKKKQADQAAARAADETGLKLAEDAEKTAELELKKNEIISHIDAEKNQQNLEQARATLQQLKETFTLKRQAAAAELKILEIQRDRAETAMSWAAGNAGKMVVHAASDGVVVINSMWKSGTVADVQEGDEVRPGFPFLQIVNPSHMQVRAHVNQADIGAMREGAAVHIGLDAYPELSFPGKIEYIAAVAQVSSLSAMVRTFDVVFSLDGTDPKLLPDLSAAVDVELERQPNVLVAPRDAVVNENGHHYVRIKSGASFDKQEVQVGPANNQEQVILSGVEPGAILLRSPD
ncbi:MAG TPA: HlyD family efflux transporter periplasmic adaptor subunit [Candidatus Angelobacter sp.]|nr:HlyD family efflux transporter periplasmic adaptor subunit [Candidatus Angelobacter sp.]